MDQKNTIIKCKAHPNCLFNHNGICDNYVINIGVNGKCESYVETELSEHCDETFLMTMKVATFNAPNKNKSVISDWDYAATPDICKTCKKVVYGQPCKWKDVAYGVWTCYERDESIKRAGTLDICWWCDFFNSEKRSCEQKDPDIDRYGCHSSQSTGGNR